MTDVTEFLEHHGVKGQKWGVRKRRNEAARKAQFAPKGSKFQKPGSRLSDDKLKERIKRMELEKKYNELNAPKQSEGKKFAQEVLKGSGKSAAGTAVGATVSFAVGTALRRRFGGG